MFDHDEDEEENFLDDVLKRAYEEEQEEAEKERIKNLLHHNANLFYNEISKDDTDTTEKEMEKTMKEYRKL